MRKDAKFRWMALLIECVLQTHFVVYHSLWLKHVILLAARTLNIEQWIPNTTANVFTCALNVTYCHASHWNRNMKCKPSSNSKIKSFRWNMKRATYLPEKRKNQRKKRAATMLRKKWQPKEQQQLTHSIYLTRIHIFHMRKVSWQQRKISSNETNSRMMRLFLYVFGFFFGALVLFVLLLLLFFVGLICVIFWMIFSL